MAEMRTIKRGSSGLDCQTWQTFLRGGQIDDDGNCTAALGDAIVSDGKFGPATEKATKAWQAKNGLAADGIVGPNTWKIAIADSFPASAVPDGSVQADQDVNPDPMDTTAAQDDASGIDKHSAAWPPRPSWAKPLVTQAQREALFGKLEYVAAPTASNPEAVHITNDFAKNIVKFDIPLLSKNPISMHKLAGPQFQAWCEAIVAKGLGDRVFGFAGCWVPRFVRGSRTSLSNHSFGSAIDFCVPFNKRGHQSALLGEKGCVRELAVFCDDFGIWWGAYFTKEDGMHWEINRLLTPAELAAAKAKHGVPA